MENTAELKIQLNAFITDALKSHEFKINISSHIKDEIKDIILSKKEEIFSAKAYKNIKSSIKQSIMNTLKDKSFKEEIYKFLDYNLKALEKSTKPLDKVIPPAFINALKVYIYNHKEDVMDSFKKFITNKDVSNRINKEIINVLNGINPMVSRFISASTIQAKLVSGINDYLKEPNNIKDIMNFINSKLDEIMKKRISELTVYFPDEGRKSLIVSVTNSIADNLSSEALIDTAINKLEEKFKEDLSSLKKNHQPLNSAIDNIVDSLVKDYYDGFWESHKSQELINEFSASIIDKFLEKPLKDFM